MIFEKFGLGSWLLLVVLRLLVVGSFLLVRLICKSEVGTICGARAILPGTVCVFLLNLIRCLIKANSGLPIKAGFGVFESFGRRVCLFVDNNYWVLVVWFLLVCSMVYFYANGNKGRVVCRLGILVGAIVGLVWCFARGLLTFDLVYTFVKGHRDGWDNFFMGWGGFSVGHLVYVVRIVQIFVERCFGLFSTSEITIYDWRWFLVLGASILGFFYCILSGLRQGFGFQFLKYSVPVDVMFLVLIVGLGVFIRFSFFMLFTKITVGEWFIKLVWVSSVVGLYPKCESGRVVVKVLWGVLLLRGIIALGCIGWYVL